MALVNAAFPEVGPDHWVNIWDNSTIDDEKVCMAVSGEGEGKRERGWGGDGAKPFTGGEGSVGFPLSRVPVSVPIAVVLFVLLRHSPFPHGLACSAGHQVVDPNFLPVDGEDPRPSLLDLSVAPEGHAIVAASPAWFVRQMVVVAPGDMDMFEVLMLTFPSFMRPQVCVCVCVCVCARVVRSNGGGWGVACEMRR